MPTILFLSILSGPAVRAEPVQSPVVAGLFYPGDSVKLESTLAALFHAVPTFSVPGKIRALIVPHAGYIYSGLIAAHACQAVRGQRYDLVVVIGPSHHYGGQGVLVDGRTGHRTPLGIVAYDTASARVLLKEKTTFGNAVEPFTVEHALEVQLPFLQSIFRKDLRVVEVLMTEQDWLTCQQLAKAIAKIGRKKRILIVASSDLSHYHPDAKARKLDGLVASRIARFEAKELCQDIAARRCEACGAGPIAAAMLSAVELGADRAKILAYATSGDVTGDSSSVVGYLAAAFYKEEVGTDLGFTADDQQTLRRIARTAIEQAARNPQVGTDAVLKSFKNIPERLKTPYGVFVTIKSRGELRGCIGRLVADLPLYQATAEMAIAAATQDPRFDPVPTSELGSLTIDISVLTPFRRITGINDIVIGRDGLLMRRGLASGLLLPQVAVDEGWDRLTFLEQTCGKAGLHKDAWKEAGTEVYSFSAQVF